MLTVEKIGGTSMSQFQDVLQNIIIGKRKESEYFNRIFVVSAYNNVTNWLLEHKKTKEPGIYMKFLKNENYKQSLDELLLRLVEINRTFADIKLNQQEADAFITERICQAKNYLNSLASVLATGYVNRNNILLAAREILSSIGEAHSAFNSVNILQNNGINATFIDLCGFNDSDYLTIDERIHKEFSNIEFSKTVCIATGYTKGTEGIMREFDRGYSEVTFSKIAVEVKADEAIIHKEFHLSSADPKVVGLDKSIPVGNTNFNVADQLADIGMEAIHPKASKPLEMAGINIRIKNTFEPEHPGTLISTDYIGKQSKVEIVAGSDQVVALEIHDPMMVGTVGFDLGIMQIMGEYKLSYILKATNANSITIVVWEDDLAEEMINELREKYSEVTVKPVAIACAIGTNIAQPGILYKAAQALSDNGINIEGVSQSLKQVNMQFIINREDFKKAIIALNDSLCVNNH
jgi:aspartate kinase